MASANANSVKRGNHTDQQGEERQDISWQESKLALKDRLLHLCNNDFMSDVAFMVQSKRIPAHKIFLAASSPVFDAMFNGPLAQKGESEIEIPDCKDPNAFTEFLRYFYVGESNFSGNYPMTILYLAKKYIVPGLEQNCRSYIASSLNESNVFSTLHWSFRSNDEGVKELSMNFICNHIQSLAERESFCQLNLQCLTCILGSDLLQVNEIDLFLAVDKWCSKEVERRGAPVCLNKKKKKKRRGASEDGSITKRSVLGDALYLIRFPVMSSAEFVDHCAYSELLSADESRDILCYINQSERRPRRTAYRFGFPQQQQSNSATLIEEKLKFPKIKRQPVIQEFDLLA